MRVLLLLSGGIDSPVAARLLQENGHTVGAVHFSQQPFTDESPEQKAKDVADALGLEALWISQAGERFGDLTRELDHRLYFVLSKRLMLRAGERIAKREGYDALATGENLGQVSSQTLPNLACVHEAASMPVLTPLLGLDKNEIIDLARSFDTYDISEGPEMCDTIGPDHPETKARIQTVHAQEAKLDLDEAVQDLVNGTVRVPAAPTSPR